MKEARIERARNYFMSGYNCSQSVVAAFADIYGIPEDLALRMSASFGAGIGRMRQTCGTACGMFLLAGLECGSVTAGDSVGKSANYAVVQSLAAKFKEINGSLICAELLQMAKCKVTSGTDAEARTPDYYKKRPCVRMVEIAASIYCDFLSERGVKF